MSKSTRPIVRVHNQETDEVIDREMNDAEFAKYEQDVAAKESEKAQARAKETAKLDLLIKLGITAEEAKLLFS